MTWRRPLPILVGVLIAVLPPPPGLTLEGWRYFAIFVAVIVGLITESLPGAATGLIGITVTAMLGLVEPRPLDSIQWALTGFADGTVWLMFVTFMSPVPCPHRARAEPAPRVAHEADRRRRGDVDAVDARVPAGRLLLFVVQPVLIHRLCRPAATATADVPEWARRELVAMGAVSRREASLGALAILALSLWIFGGPG